MNPRPQHAVRAALSRGGLAWLAALAAAAATAADWPPGVQRIEIASSLDGSPQAAMFAPASDLPAGSREARPLLVALHTWSSGYDQPGSIPWAEGARARGWVFIHPDFRGPNTGPQAGGSEAAIQDVLDAVREARKRANVDPRRIYLAGYSGGGHAALMVVSRSREIWAGVSVWSPITDLAVWHGESRARGLNRYANDIEAICGGPPAPGSRALEECNRRSPISFLQALIGLPLDLNTGIRDGHAPRIESGTVPIGHSLRAFNLLVPARDALPKDLMAELERKGSVPDAMRFRKVEPDYGRFRVLFRRESGPVRLTLFDGDHDVAHEAALGWLARQRRRP